MLFIVLLCEYKSQKIEVFYDINLDKIMFYNGNNEWAKDIIKKYIYIPYKRHYFVKYQYFGRDVCSYIEDWVRKNILSYNKNEWVKFIRYENELDFNHIHYYIDNQDAYHLINDNLTCEMNLADKKMLSL